ncbi:MAG: hypothetical protein QXN59_01295 [Candidatus Micrarchaeaceae archaeon]
MRGTCAFALALAALFGVAGIAHASYTVQNVNTTVTLYPNNSAHVVQVVQFIVSNQSANQYTTARVALNLTVSAWESLIGSDQVDYDLINPHSGVRGLALLPGPLTVNGNHYVADIILNYYVDNVTSYREIAPRTFYYSFNPDVLNFQSSQSGVNLPSDARFNIVLPQGSKIISVYPVPDYPPVINYTSRNISMISWYSGEPLSKFQLNFEMTESRTAEVIGFLKKVYAELGLLTYVILGGLILGFIVYTYYKVR